MTDLLDEATIIRDEIEGKSNIYLSENTHISLKVLTLLAQQKRAEASELLINVFKRRNRFYSIINDEKTEIWFYHEGIYVPYGISFIKEQCRVLLKDAYTTRFANLCVDKIYVDTMIPSNSFFQTNYINEIPVQNGILNIITKKLSPFTEDKIFFNKLPMDYDETKDCPNVKKHFNTVLKKGTDIDIIQELLGFLLYKEYKIEKSIMFTGKGRNGKGKTLDLMKRFVGSENCASASLQSLEKEPFCVSELFGKMANLAGDLSMSALNQTGKFKELTGRDLITAPRKFKTPIYFENYAKMIFACNELPQIKDISDGFWERWILIDFPFQFMTKKEIERTSEDKRKNLKEIDVDIVEKLTTPDELSGMLNWSLEGLNRLLKNKTFSGGTSRNELKEDWMRKSSSCRAFIKDLIDVDNSCVITIQRFAKRYAEYCIHHNIRQESPNKIKMAFLELLGVIDGKTYIDGIQKRCWRGVRFKDEQYGDEATGCNLQQINDNQEQISVNEETIK